METANATRYIMLRITTIIAFTCIFLPRLASTDEDLSETFHVKYGEFTTDLPCKMIKEIVSGRNAWMCNSRQLRSIPAIPRQPFTVVNLNGNNLTTIYGQSFINNTDIVAIYLGVNSISVIESNAFAGLQHLQSLKLAINKLTSLNADIFQETPHLAELDLRFNNFASIPYCALQPLNLLQIFNMEGQVLLPPLTSLTVHNHTCLFEDAKLPSLSYINLAGINEVGSSLVLTNMSFKSPVEMDNVQELDLRFYDRVVIEGEFEYRTVSFLNLTSLAIGCFPFDDFQFIDIDGLTSLDIECFIKQAVINLNFWTLQHLVQFPLVSLSIVKHYVGNIADNTFIWTPFLRHLNLQNNAIQFISQGAFQGLERLEVLDLSCNSLQELPFDALQVFNESSSLREINLSHNQLQITTKIPDTPFGMSSKLLKIDLSSNVITRIAPGYLNITSLKYLDLSDNQMSDVLLWLEQIPNLEVLNLARNRFVSLPPPGWPTQMHSLKNLTLSAVKTIGYGFLHGDITQLIRSAPKLEHLDLSNSYSPCGNVVFKGSIESTSSFLITFDLSSNCLSSEDFYEIYTGHHPSMVSLILAENKITELRESIFANSPAIQYLDLSHNQISYIPENTFKYLGNLSYLYLQYNVLATLDSLKPVISQLIILNVAHNSINGIPVNFFPETDGNKSSALQLIDISGNPLSCTCENIVYFQAWFQKDTVVDVLFERLSSYECNSPPEFQHTLFTQVKLDCRPQWPIYLGTSLVVFVLICVSAILAIRYRWRIRYEYFILRLRLRRRRYRIFVDEEISMGIQYDAFVSYAQDSDKDLEWIQSKLLKNIEECENPMRLYFAGRDETPGSSKFDVILENMQQSRKTILILTPSFMIDEWCYFEMQMSHMRLFDESLDVIIPVLLEEIPDNQITLLMRKILLSKSCLEWTEDPIGQELFWGKLREYMQQPSRIDRRFDVDRYNENRE